jgi:CheY-like chemotaxis protein
MRILIADDMEYARANIMEMVKKIFPEAEIDTFSDGTHAWEAVKKREYDLLFTDVRMIIMHRITAVEQEQHKTSTP